MPAKVEQIPGEPIVVTTVTEPFDPRQDIATTFAEITQLRLAIQGDVVLILDLRGARTNFSQMVAALAQAADGIRAGRAAGIDRPPITIFVGSGILADFASKAMGQRQYGGVKGHLCATQDEAIALAREVLLTKKG